MLTEEIGIKKVSELMSQNVLTGRLNFSFTDIMRLFSEMNFHHLPIINDEKEIQGIISTNDILKMLTLKMPFLKDTRDETVNMEIDIMDVMTMRPKVILSTSTIKEALSVFSKHHIHALPVVKEGKLVGIITSNDILAALNN